MEGMNPGGSGKDRAARYMLLEIIRNNRVKPGGLVVEGTSGSTGISLAHLCRSLNLRLRVVLPDDQAEEKAHLLRCLGADVMRVPNCAISNPSHYVNTAKRIVSDLSSCRCDDAVFVDQFENVANFRCHFEETGPEIYNQMLELSDHACSSPPLDAFVMSAGTGGTIAGVSQYLKSRDKSIRVYLADPQGSSLFHRVKHGVCYTAEQRERTVRKHRYDSIVEGVGLDRVTSNFAMANIDDAIRISDQEVVDMAHWFVANEGILLGSSSALNMVGVCEVARRMGPGHVIVTVICDSGQRHLSRFWNKQYIEDTCGLKWPTSDASLRDGCDKEE